MMKIVNVHQAKTHLSRLLDRAHAGEEIVIAKSGEPYARLVPLIGGTPKRASGTRKGLVELTKTFFEQLPTGWTGETIPFKVARRVSPSDPYRTWWDRFSA